MLLSVALLQLAWLHLHLALAGYASAVALLVFLLLVLVQLGLREKVLLGLAGLATVVLYTQLDASAQLVMSGLNQAAFLTAFMILLALLRDGAASSRSVLQLGHFLTTRPPGRRYVAIHSGAQLLGMFLNFGALTLLGPLIQRGAKAAADSNTQLAEWRERRQLSALVRGFSWVICCSPATVSMAITISVVANARLWVVCICGLLSANIGSFAIGWLLDRRAGLLARRQLLKSHSLPNDNPAASAFPRNACARLLLLSLSLFGVAIVVSQFNEVSLVAALMLASPLVTVVWIVLQSRQRAAGTASTAERLRHIVCHSVPAGTPEAVTLAAAGYLGIVAAALLDPQQFAQQLSVLTDGNPWVYIAMMATIPIASNLALPPIMTVTFLGSFYSALPSGTLNPDLVACALLWGWGLNLTASPFGGVPLILGRITGIAGTTLSWRWNGWFSVLIFIWCSAALLVLSALLPRPGSVPSASILSATGKPGVWQHAETTATYPLLVSVPTTAGHTTTPELAIAWRHDVIFCDPVFSSFQLPAEEYCQWQTKY